MGCAQDFYLYSSIFTHLYLYSFDSTLDIFGILCSFVSISSAVWYERLLFLLLTNFTKTPVILSPDVWCEGIVSIVIQFRENTWAIVCISSTVLALNWVQLITWTKWVQNFEISRKFAKLGYKCPIGVQIFL